MIPILFQDEWLVAIDKPAGHLVHASDTPGPHDLVVMQILRDQIGTKIHVLHRLDQPTSGLVLFATDKHAAKKLRQDFEKRRIKKDYLAIVHGHPFHPSWTCEIPLQKNPTESEKPASTTFHVLEKLPLNLTLLQAQPHTGRFHQIRRHLLHSGHPIVGDYRYLEEDDCHTWGEKLGIGTRMLLQAKSLTFTHPITKDLITIEAPCDPLIRKLSQQK